MPRLLAYLLLEMKPDPLAHLLLRHLFLPEGPHFQHVLRTKQMSEAVPENHIVVVIACVLTANFSHSASSIVSELSTSNSSNRVSIHSSVTFGRRLKISS